MIMHKANLRGGAACGAQNANISASGAECFITCPKCRALSRTKSKLEMLAYITQASEGFREAHK